MIWDEWEEDCRVATILVVDNEQVVLDALGDLLQSNGYAVIKAASGRAGVKLYAENHPDLVVVDVLMPEMSGIEMVRTIRKISPGSKVVALSGGGRLQDPNFLKIVEGLLDAKVIKKPIDNHGFLQTVAAVLEAKGV